MFSCISVVYSELNCLISSQPVESSVNKKVALIIRKTATLLGNVTSIRFNGQAHQAPWLQYRTNKHFNFPFKCIRFLCTILQPCRAPTDRRASLLFRRFNYNLFSPLPLLLFVRGEGAGAENSPFPSLSPYANDPLPSRHSPIPFAR